MIIGYAVKPLQMLASFRFRVDIPMLELKRMGYQLGFGVGDITVCPKQTVPIDLVRQIRDSTIVVWDVSDDHFDTPKHVEYFREMPKLAHFVTCTTETLRDRIYRESGVRATVITDPVEFQPKSPRVGTEKFLWYGNHTNLKAALEVLPKIRGEVRLICNQEGPGIIPFSLDAMQEGLEWCDAVVIPVKREGSPRWDGKSPNRMTEAINAGRYVIANPMPAYDGYGMWQGDILDGVEWFRNNQQQALEAVKEAQPLVSNKHSPRAVAQEWANLFDYIWAVAARFGRGISM